MKAQLFASGTFANGTAMRKIATDASRTASASRRSLRPAGSVDKNTERSFVNGRAVRSDEPRGRSIV
jgi:hypothetical protein